MLAAARCVALEVALARAFGGEKTEVLERRPVRRIDLDAEKPTLVTDTMRIEADRLIVTAGAWTRQLFPRFSALLRPTRQKVLYFRPADAAAFEPGRFPVFIFKGAGELNDFYGMPSFLGMGVKTARHGGPETDPNVEERSVGEADRALVRRFLERAIPALAEAPIDVTETCLYTVAPDDHFRLDRLPGRPDVIVASPCSGHGFKFSCLVGSILADLATRGETAIDVTPWRLG
jgi:sarcosine oxidase